MQINYVSIKKKEKHNINFEYVRIKWRCWRVEEKNEQE